MVDELADDARVIREVTVGPWKDAERYGAVIADGVPWMVDETERKEYGGAVICESAHQRNRAFIVRARTRYPELVAEVRELRRENGSLRADRLEIHKLLCDAGIATHRGIFPNSRELSAVERTAMLVARAREAP